MEHLTVQAVKMTVEGDFAHRVVDLCYTVAITKEV